MSNIKTEGVKLLTYQKKNKGSRLTFAGGTIKVIDSCIYLVTDREKIPLIFPITFKWLNNVITDGNLKLIPDQELRLNGHIVQIDDITIKSLNISENSCLKDIKRAWIYNY